jgi:DNA-binding CsgD family transcriptional regulator
MMVKVEPLPILAQCPYPIPSFLSPSVDRVLRGESLFDAIQSITRQLGFESFVYGMSLSKTHRRDERFYVWATVADGWLREYDQNSYIEIDPRVCYGWDVLPPPLIWDASLANGNHRIEHFLERASRFGIGSGVAVYLRDDRGKIMVALSSPRRLLDAQARADYCAALGNVMHLSSLFHWIFVKRYIERNIPPAQQGHALSERETSCLQFAAHGMTSVDIGLKLGITPRTADFHFANSISKLGALNRHEAIATAVARGIVDLNQSPCELLHRPTKRRSRQK